MGVLYKNTSGITADCIDSMLYMRAKLNERDLTLDIDYEYIKDILQTLKDLQAPYANGKDFYSRYLRLEAADTTEKDHTKFIFHWHLIVENGLVSTNKDNIYSLADSGLICSPQNPMKFMTNLKPLRLTTRGIDFLSSLQEPKVLEQVKSKLKSQGLPTVIEVAKQLTMGVLMQKLGLQ